LTSLLLGGAGREQSKEPEKDKQTALDMATMDTERWAVGDAVIMGPIGMVLQAQNTCLMLSLQALHAKLDQLQKQQARPTANNETAEKNRNGEPLGAGAVEVMLAS